MSTQIRRFPIWFLVLAVLLSIFMLSWFVRDIYEIYDALQKVKQRDLGIEKSIGEIVYLDEVLTMSARMQAVSRDADMAWEKRYKAFEPKLTEVIASVLRQADLAFPNSGIAHAITNTDVANLKLVDMEVKSFQAAREGRFEDAKQILFSDDYQEQKKIYISGIVEFERLFTELSHANQLTEENELHLRLVILSIVMCMLFTGLGLLLYLRHNWAKTMVATNLRLAQKTKELEDLNANLDSKIEERTSALKKSRIAALNMMEDAEAERKKAVAAAAELKQAHAQLIEAEKSEMLVQIAAGAAHEVKNPLAIIIQGIEYIMTQIKPNGSVTSVLGDMENAADRADGIIKSLLDLSAPTQLSLNPENLDFIIDNSLLLVKNNLDVKRIKVIKKLMPKIPAIRADKNKLIQVLINIFTNAADAMSDGGTLSIETYLSHAKEVREIVLEVKDTGTGIPKDMLPKIFEPFVTTKRGKGGTGLGLPTVRSIIQMHQGRIEMKNRTDEPGAVAVIIFPII